MERLGPRAKTLQQAIAFLENRHFSLAI